MAYDDWDAGHQDFFEDLPGVPYLDDEQRDYAETLYDVAFTHTAEELEAMGYSMDDVGAIREEFFDSLGIDAADFDWEGWREAMGYE